MLPKKNRITKNGISLIFERGKFVSSPNLTFKYIAQTDSGVSQVSFLCPKSVSKSAVKRNLLRRRGYRALQKLWEDLPSGILGAFVFGKNGLAVFGATDKNNKDKSLFNLENEIKTILRKIN